MERTISKFQFEPNDRIEFTMPIGAEILTVQMQNGQPCVWALVNPQVKTEKRILRIVGTGHTIIDKLGKYIGTFQLMEGQLIFHLFEL